MHKVNHLLDLLKRTVCAQSLQLKLMELACMLFIRCVWPFHNSIFIDTVYQWVHGTLL